MSYVEASLRREAESSVALDGETHVVGEAIDPVEAAEPDYRCPECQATDPREHARACTVGRRQT